MGFARFMNSSLGRGIRMLAGAIVIAIGLAMGGVGGWIIAGVGLVPLVAGALGLCLLAPLLHVPVRAGSSRRS